MVTVMTRVSVLTLSILAFVPAEGASERLLPPQQTQSLTLPVTPSTASPRSLNGVSPPVVLSQPEPEFSKEARRDRISGIVMVHTEVDESGRPTKVRVTQGLGHGLDEKAVENVKQYRFKPAIRDGKPVKFEMNIAVNFQG
jgi:TonB family protein